MKDCCQNEGNLTEEQLPEDLVCRTCAVCGCKHYELTVDPVVLLAEGEDI